MNFFIKFLKGFIITYNERNFINSINSIFPKNKFFNENIILVENVNNKIHHIPYIYLLNYLVKKFKSEVVLYNPNQLLSFKRILFNFLIHLKKPFFYKMLNALFKTQFLNNYQMIRLDESEKKKLNDIKRKIKNKQNFFDLKIYNIHFGDILYDQYLKKYRVPTIRVKDDNFENYIDDSFKLIIFWIRFFKNKKIKTVISSHATYWNGIITRIAIKNKIPVFLSDINNTFYLSKKNIFPYKNYLENKKKLKKFSNSRKIKMRALANERLKLRMLGKVGVDMVYSTKSAWRIKKTKKYSVLKKSNKIKILISAHCFFDSPNGLGKNLFVDFYEWIEFLSKISHKTNYDWYIKTHPDFLPGNLEIINKLSKKFKNLQILDSSTSHHDIISDNIDFVLTVYGTVGIEYAYNKIPVINASLNNPNINFKFNLHPKNLKQYSKTLESLNKIKLNISKKDVLENYYMNHMIKDNNIYFSNKDKFNKLYELKLHNLDSNFYKYWIKNLTRNHHYDVIKKVENFLKSKRYSL